MSPEERQDWEYEMSFERELVRIESEYEEQRFQRFREASGYF